MSDEWTSFGAGTDFSIRIPVAPLRPNIVYFRAFATIAPGMYPNFTWTPHKRKTQSQERRLYTGGGDVTGGHV